MRSPSRCPPSVADNLGPTGPNTTNVPHLESIGSEKLIEQRFWCVHGLLSQIMSYPGIIYLGVWLQLRLCTSSQLWYKTGYVAHANTSLLSSKLPIYHGQPQPLHTIVLVHVIVIAALYEMPLCDVVGSKLALLRGHFPHNLTNEFSISNIDQVNCLYTSQSMNLDFPFYYQIHLFSS